MNSVKINNKNNLSKKLRKQQTPKPEQLKRNGKKTKNISEFSWQEKNHLSGNKWDMTYLVCSLDSTVPSLPGLG